jgi:Bacterial Ig-like domain (group 3)/Divergent InlB B-repeat domain
LLILGQQHYSKRVVLKSNVDCEASTGIPHRLKCREKDREIGMSHPAGSLIWKFLVGTVSPLLFTFSLTAQSMPTVRGQEHHDVSPPLGDLIQNAPKQAVAVREAEPARHIPLPPGLTMLPEDPVRQKTAASIATFAPMVSLGFEGLGNGQYGFQVTGAPPDTNGAVGTTQYVQWVNTSFAIFNKSTGALISGPTAGNTLWSGFGGGCESNNDGDPIVLYDKLANRWVFSQFSVSTTPYLQCIAVSMTSDATGSYNRYSFQYNNVDDYPKMGVWPDAYYETFNMFNGNTFVGTDACAYDRNAMLNGAAATQICFQQGSSVGGVLPSDLDGTTPPPSGSPNYMLYFGTNSLNLFTFHVDFATPANSSFSGPTVISVAPFMPLCNGGTCVPQPGTTNQLDSLADRLMYRLAYRNLGTHESLVVNHSVATSSGGGIRWYEIQNPSGTPVLAQQGTFAPDSNYRWMGSIAMDKAGDIAVGYSVSNGSSVFPSIAFTGRVSTDPSGTLEAETSVVTGSGSQTSDPSTGPLTRWGDYSAMQVDPVDDCTFWYTQEYIKTNGAFNWSTRIATFRFPNCGTSNFPLTVTLAGTGTGTVTSSPTGISCPSTCSANYAGGTPVTLTASASAGSTFAGWSGACSGTGSCSVTMNSAQSVTATFNPVTVSFPLSVTLSGNGLGSLTSAPAGINCPSTCSANFASGTTVTLTPSANTGSTFAGWSGACSGTGSCSVTMNSAQSVAATFNSVTASFPLSVTISGNGSGSLTSAPAGINCPSTCSANFASGTTVTLTPSANAGSTFAGWSGACSGTGSCSVTMNSAQTVTATFNVVSFPLSVTVAGGGLGSVTSAPGGINCPGTCSANFAGGTTVTLTPNANAGSTFAGWSGACTGGSTCMISMNAAQAVTGTFRIITTTTLTVSSAQANAGSSVTFAAKVSAASGTITPTGTVTFNDGSTVLGTAPLSSGTASLTTSSLGARIYSVAASYAGDTNFTSSSSSAVALTVVDIVVTAAQPSLTVARGKSVQTSLTVTPAPLASFHPTVTFACSGLPLQSSCSFNPPTLVTNGAAMSTTLTIQTTAPSAGLKQLLGRAVQFYALLLPGFVGIVFVKRNGKRRPGKVRVLGLVSALLLSTIWWTACGVSAKTGSGGVTSQNSGTPVGSTMVTITATSSGPSPLSKPITITLTVQ